MDWQSIDTAPKDGTIILVKREYKGKIVHTGKAAWRSVNFGPLYDPISGERFAEAETASGWMHPDRNKRVPEPTHWNAPSATPHPRQGA